MTKLKKFLIASILGSSLFGGIFFTQNVYSAREDKHVTAQDLESTTGPTQQDPKNSLQDWANTLQAILKMLYLVMWPLISIAGAALSNDLVYGKIFGMDIALWGFWTIMKNIANLALGFMFVGGVLMYMFRGSKGQTDRKTMIPKFLMAVIGIQMSWFLVMALVDIGTITTYTVGGLPLSVTKQTTIDNFKIFNPVSVGLDTQANNFSQTSFYVLNEGDEKDGGLGLKIVMPCFSTGGKGWIDGSNTEEWNNYITGVTQYLKKDNFSFIDIKTQDRFVIGKGAAATANSLNAQIAANPDSKEKKYTAISTNPNGGDDWSSFIASMQCISNGRLASVSTDSSVRANSNGKNLDFTLKTTAGKTLSDYINGLDGSKKMSGPLYSLYVSILSMTSLTEDASGNSTSNFVVVVIVKTILGLMLIVPLAVLAVVLVMRVAYLWIVICFSPILILALAFGSSKLKGGLEKFANLQNILGLIFLPTIVTFAISIGVMFMGAILSMSMNKDGTYVGSDGNNIMHPFHIDSYPTGNSRCYDFDGKVTICQVGAENQSMGIGNMFAYLMIGLLGASIMWNIVFLALKSSKFTEGIAQNIQGMGEGFLKSTPIVPIPGQGLVSAQALQNFGNSYVSANSPLIIDRVNAQTSRMTNLMSEMKGTPKESLETGRSTIFGGSSGILSTSTINGKSVTTADGEKFVSTINSGVADYTNIDQYLSDMNTDEQNKWIEMLDALRTQSGHTGSAPNIKDMLSDPKFMGYLMATSGKSADEIVKAFYKKSETSGSTINSILSSSSKLESQGVDIGNGIKFTNFGDKKGGLLYYKDSNGSWKAKLVGPNMTKAQADEVVGLLPTVDDKGNAINYEKLKSDLGLGDGFKFDATNKKWNYDPGIANTAQIKSAIDKIKGDYSFVSNGNLNNSIKVSLENTNLKGMPGYDMAKTSLENILKSNSQDLSKDIEQVSLFVPYKAITSQLKLKDNSDKEISLGALIDQIIAAGKVSDGS